MQHWEGKTLIVVQILGLIPGFMAQTPEAHSLGVAVLSCAVPKEATLH